MKTFCLQEVAGGGRRLNLWSSGMIVAPSFDIPPPPQEEKVIRVDVSIKKL